MPHRKSLGMIWRRAKERYRMEGTKCENCGTHFFPGREFCPRCRRQGRIAPYKMKGLGKVFSYSLMYVPQAGFELMTPYVLAIVELVEGPKVTAQVVDVSPSEVSIGMPVKAVFRKVTEDGDSGIIHYSFKFQPVEA